MKMTLQSLETISTDSIFDFLDVKSRLQIRLVSESMRDKLNFHLTSLIISILFPGKDLELEFTTARFIVKKYGLVLLRASSQFEKLLYFQVQPNSVCYTYLLPRPSYPSNFMILWNVLLGKTFTGELQYLQLFTNNPPGEINGTIRRRQLHRQDKPDASYLQKMLSGLLETNTKLIKPTWVYTRSEWAAYVHKFMRNYFIIEALIYNINRKTKSLNFFLAIIVPFFVVTAMYLFLRYIHEIALRKKFLLTSNKYTYDGKLLSNSMRQTGETLALHFFSALRKGFPDEEKEAKKLAL